MIKLKQPFLSNDIRRKSDLQDAYYNNERFTTSVL